MDMHAKAPIHLKRLFEGVPILLKGIFKGFLPFLKGLFKGILSFLKGLFKGFLSFLHLAQRPFSDIGNSHFALERFWNTA